MAIRRTGTTTIAATWLILPLLTIAPAAADKTSYYDISGASVAELRAAMNRQGPVGPDGVRRDALTTWQVRWAYDTAASPTVCTLTAWRVSVDVSMTLPRWTNESKAPASLVALWRRYHAALLLHEDGHRKAAMAAADAMREVVRKVPRHANCADMKRTVDAAAAKILDEYRNRERQYDLQTRHGVTQGAHFP